VARIRKLNARKGFTLVELIVVVAIIGVLVGMLVPTMINYTLTSRVTAMNSTAASLKNDITAWFAAMFSSGYPLKVANTQRFQIEVTGTGVFNVAASEIPNLNACFNGPHPNGYENELKEFLEDKYANKIKSGYIMVEFSGGVAEGVLYSGSKSLGDGVGSNGSWTGGEWVMPGSKKDGLNADGIVFGSYPQHSID